MSCVIIFFKVDLIEYLNNTCSHTMERCEWCGCVTYSHGVRRVSEVREGAEGRQRRLRDGHRAPWGDDDDG